MLPGKKYKPEEFVQILRKRFWLIAVPFAIIAAGTAVVGRLLPDLYRSQAQIQYVPARVPEAIAGRASTSNLQDRLKSMEAVILSRTLPERMGMAAMPLRMRSASLTSMS